MIDEIPYISTVHGEVRILRDKINEIIKVVNEYALKPERIEEHQGAEEGQPEERQSPRRGRPRKVAEADSSNRT